MLNERRAISFRAREPSAFRQQRPLCTRERWQAAAGTRPARSI